MFHEPLMVRSQEFFVCRLCCINVCAVDFVVRNLSAHEAALKV